MEVKQQKMMADLFEQAAETCNSAFRTGIRMQEEVARWWTGLLGDSSPIQDLQKRAQSMMTDAMPLVQKTAEEGLWMMDQNYRNSLDLFKKIFDTAQAQSASEAREKFQAFWEASLGTMRTNTQAVVQANARALETWSEFLRRNLEGKPPEAKTSSKSAASSK